MDDTSSTGKKLTEIFDKLNIALYDQDGQIRSTYDILKDLAGEWGNLSKNEQEYIALTSSGANQLNNFLALMNGFDDAVKANETALNAQGSAVKENSRYMESLEAQLQKLKSAWEAFSNSVIQSDFVKFFLSAGTSILKAFNNDIGVTVTQFGLLTGVLTGGISLIGQFGTNLTAAIPALSGLAGGFTAISAAAPVVAAVIAAVTVAVVAGVSAWKDYHEAVYGVSDDLKEATQEARENARETVSNTEATAQVAKKYADRINELQQVEKLDNVQKAEMAHLVENLNSIIPDLNLTIEKTTGKVKQQTTELRSNIEAWKESAKQQAYQTQIQESASALTDAEIKVQQKNNEIISLQAEIDGINARRQEMYDEYNRLFEEWQAMTPGQEGKKEGYSKYAWARAQYKVYVEETDKIIKNNEKAIKERTKAIQESNIIIEREKQNLKELEAVYESIYGKDLSWFVNRKTPDLGTRTDESYLRAKSKTGDILGLTSDEQAFSPFGGKSYADWLKEQKHLLNTGKLLAEDYYANLQAMLNKYTDESIISTEERWEAEEDIFKYQQKLTEEQQRAYEQAVRDAEAAAKAREAAAKARAQAEKQAINDIKTSFTAWQDEQDYLFTTGQITESEYYDNLKAKNDELFKDKEEFQSQYWTNLEKIYKWEQQQIEDQKKAKVTEFDEWLKAQDHALAMGEITEDEYYTELKKKNDEYFKDSMENLDKYWKNEESWYKWKKQQIEEIHEAAKAALDAEIEKEKQRLELKKTEAETRKAQLEAQQDEIERLADYIQTVADAEIGKIDEKISALKDEADAITAKYKEQIDALEEQNQAIDDQITKQKLLEALAKAQQSKKYVFKDGRFQYVDDVDAIASAQEQLDEFNREQALQEKTKQLEKQRDLELEQNQLAQKALEDEKKRWEEYKQGWSNITNAYTEQQNALLAQQKLGIDVEKATWDERLSNLESFKNQYISLAAQIKAAEAEIAGYDAQISAVGSTENQDATIRRMMKENSEAWHQTSDASERERLHEMNEYLNSLLSNKGTYNAASGQWSNLSYTQSQPLSSSIGSVGVMTPSVSSSAVLGSSLINKGISGAKQALSQIFNMGNISLPNVSNAKQFVSELKNMALQAAYSRA